MEDPSSASSDTRPQLVFEQRRHELFIGQGVTLILIKLTVEMVQ